MTSRFVYSPCIKGARPFEETEVSFLWHRGMAPSQKKKNVAALHEAARDHGFNNLLEISSKSEREIGQRLSAFSLTADIGGRRVPLENVYQASKRFSNGGPHPEWLDLEPREAKRMSRNPGLGDLKGFSYQGKEIGLTPPLFYDWIYLKALLPYRDWIREKIDFDGFTDIEFNPKVSLSCQAKSFAIFLGLMRQNKLEASAASYEAFTQNFPNTL